MEFALSSDQEALREAARLVLERHAPMARVRKIVGPGTAAEDGHAPAVDEFDRELWSAMVDQGWTALEVPESAGGLGFGSVELAVLCEEIGRSVAPTPYVGHSLATDVLRRASTAEDAGAGGPELERWVERLVSGEAVACLAFAPGAGHVQPTGRGAARVSVRTEPALYASVADVAVVVTDDAVVAVDLADRRPPPQPAMDRTRSLSWLAFDGVPALAVGGAHAARRAHDRAATAYAAELLGAADRALAMSVEYAGQRVQFGHPIGSFQAVKHRLADALVDVEGMRSTVYYAAWCLAADQPDASLAASSAKAWCADAGRRVMASALQVHGGIGFTWEHDLHLYVKRVELDGVVFGDADFHRDRLAGLLADRPAEAPSLF